MADDRIEALRRTAMFGAIRDDAIGFLLERAAAVDVPAGDFFFHQDDPGSSAFLLEAGQVSVIKRWKGEEYRLRGLSAGDCFGEVALLDFGRRSASVRADADCRALEISSRDLRALGAQDTEQFALIYMNLGRELARRLRDADERLFRSRYGIDLPVEEYAFAAM